ncbi:hypothetical protein HU200_006131 [Digitaria exilis]|uniref:Ribosomal RNA methyltransferase FtsJ domain-containing protein n=1 Tax=Digitaria exilis TaxID=1010633 RepID=A0A835FT58_9POAL|nr:hypothetical protein HU200_006131 [Digitaria exilis]
MGKASKDKRDIYYRKAKEEGWRARSAFKLLQIDQEFNIFHGVKRVVDLCAAPGSWSQVLSRNLYVPAKQSLDCKEGDLPLIVAIDLQPMAPIEGVIQVQGDITNARTAEVVIRHFDGCKADLVVCDGAPDGCICLLFLVNGKCLCGLVHVLIPVICQTEAFAVCENYSPPEGFKEEDLYHLLEKVGTPSGADDLGKDYKYCTNLCSTSCDWPNTSLCHLSRADCRSGWLEGPNKVYIPFLACGDLSGYDSDRSYPLPSTEGGSYRSLDPVQPPIAPPYKTALEMKKASSHGISADTIKPSADS